MSDSILRARSLIPAALITPLLAVLPLALPAPASAHSGATPAAEKPAEKAPEFKPPGTKVIPGHGPATDVATLRRFRAFMSDLVTEVERTVKAGLSKPDAVRTIRMDQYPEIKPAFRTLGNGVAVIYDEVAAGR